MLSLEVHCNNTSDSGRYIGEYLTELRHFLLKYRELLSLHCFRKTVTSVRFDTLTLTTLFDLDDWYA